MSSYDEPEGPNNTRAGTLSDPMISVADLADALTGATTPVLLDVQWVLGKPDAGAALYRTMHLPDAQFCDLDTVLAGEIRATGGRHPLPDPSSLQRDLRVLGLCEDRPVVVYDAADGYAAARAWWVLTWAGIRDVRVLDGGLRAWSDAGQPVATGEVAALAGDIVVRPGALPTIDAGGIIAFVEEGGTLLDARSPERFRGEHEPVDPIAGHIPGARNLPTTAIVDDAGRYVDAAAMRERVDSVRTTDADGDGDGDEETPVAVYCGSGVTATHVILGLRRIGIDAALYPGSWSDWITDPDRPRAAG
ncbi:thiosulfate/3-mercaptopyruvate sulfurtransferase [Antricoccus suffuscus]|uniref:Thiosulfate/3-mercaptopyruvate sulfurtransferase n=1 Tax=Antricoccus suffuscus TaxID=1629062 RepID=A0A2T1A4W0_9ACTN|nr:rhodanese-like domain-containing protein [Antricoccus suffuscus]PRZ43641.1 thiosulfate/3-mercaptopyruvate sulfurtransferase [Antricoccus suffuscus]